MEQLIQQSRSWEAELSKSEALHALKEEVRQEEARYGFIPESVRYLLQAQLGHLVRSIGEIMDPAWHLSCQSSPFVAADCAAFLDNKLVVIRRMDSGTLAIPGGFVNYGESFEETAARELEEETGVCLVPGTGRFLGLYDDPKRDPRSHIISVTYIGEGTATELKPQKEEAAEVLLIGRDDFFALTPDAWYADHHEIAGDAFQRFHQD